MSYLVIIARTIEKNLITEYDLLGSSATVDAAYDSAAENIEGDATFGVANADVLDKNISYFAGTCPGCGELRVAQVNTLKPGMIVSMTSRQFAEFVISQGAPIH